MIDSLYWYPPMTYQLMFANPETYFLSSVMIGTGGQSSAFSGFRRGRLGYSMTLLIVGVCHPALGDDFRRSYSQSVL